jgi:hemerythrin-like domain-containing protein
MASGPEGMKASSFLYQSPSVGPETPFELLEACHERVQRSLALMQKLQDYLLVNGHDASAASAANDVLRYFNLAAPHHHQDEELHVFPPLLVLQDDRLAESIHQLIADHRTMEKAWVNAAAVLQAIAKHASAAWTPLNSTQVQSLRNFASLYEQHIALEENQIYPRGRQTMSQHQLRDMSKDMVLRRTQT